MTRRGTRPPRTLGPALVLGVSLVSACASTGRRDSGAPDPSAPVSRPGSTASSTAGNPSPATATLYVARRRWHIDVGFAAADLQPPLAGVASRFPGARYVFFGFGDRHYLMSKDHETTGLLAALWPGPGLLLVTALDDLPARAFGARQVVEITLTPGQSGAIQAFIGHSMQAAPEGSSAAYARGPYSGSAYYAALPRYSGLHTCNTWAAEALQSGGLPVRSRLTLMAAQLWRQVLRLRASSVAARSIAGRRVAVLAYGGGGAARRDYDRRLGGGRGTAAADAAGQQTGRGYRTE